MTNSTAKRFSFSTFASVAKLACVGLALLATGCDEAEDMDATDSAEEMEVFALDGFVMQAEDVEFIDEADLEVHAVTEIGDVWADDCNLCVLTKYGATCTIQACKDSDAADNFDIAATCEDGEYVEGEMWMESCNMCTCTAEGSVCTIKECDPDSLPH